MWGVRGQQLSANGPADSPPGRPSVPVYSTRTRSEFLLQSADALLCGRVLLFLAKLLPLTERSGVNLTGAFNADNDTPVEEVAEVGSWPAAGKGWDEAAGSWSVATATGGEGSGRWGAARRQQRPLAACRWLPRSGAGGGARHAACGRPVACCGLCAGQIAAQCQSTRVHSVSPPLPRTRLHPRAPTPAHPGAVPQGALDSEGQPVDAAFYRTFWGLQAFFRWAPHTRQQEAVA